MAWGIERIERRRQVRSGYVDDLLALLYPELHKPLDECRLLDLGCGLGTISIPAAKIVRSVLGIDIEPAYLEKAREWAEEERLRNVTFSERSATELEAGRFDIVLCDYVLEHVDSPDALVAAIARHLELDGAYYLSTNNKWWPLEGHYGLPLPFISWLPRTWANRYVRVLNLGTRYDIHAISWSQLWRLLDRNGLTWSLKAPINPYTIAQKIGKRLVRLTPVFWNIGNVFQVVGQRRRTSLS